MGKHAVLLLAYGTPDSADGVECFLADIMGGRLPSAELTAELKARYEAIGGVSPLTGITMNQAKALTTLLAERDKGWPVYVGMRHWSPRIVSTLEQMIVDGVTSATVLILAPHDCDLTASTYLKALEQGIAQTACTIVFAWAGAWSQQPALIAAQTESLQAALKKAPEGAHVVFSAHSLPERILEAGDPYRDDLLANCEAIAKAAGVTQWSFAFQSAGARGGPWLGPDIADHLRDLAGDGVTAAVSMPIGFICDHLEVLFDIDIETKAVADELGVQLVRGDMMNVKPQFIEAMANAVS